MEYVVRRYPAYLEEFEALQRMAPEEDLPALKRLLGGPPCSEANRGANSRRPRCSAMDSL